MERRNIQLVEIKEANLGGCRGLATISVRGIIIRDLRIVRKAGEDFFRVFPPTTDFISKDGRVRVGHRAVVAFEDDGEWREIKKVVLEAFGK